MGAEPKLQRELGNPIEQLGGGPEPKTKENGVGPETETYFGPNRPEEGQLTGNRKIAYPAPRRARARRAEPLAASHQAIRTGTL